ncbi:MAG: SGNH/GDSL hydrolase family protein [Solirubrobacterales bacterium]
MSAADTPSEGLAETTAPAASRRMLAEHRLATVEHPRYNSYVAIGDSFSAGIDPGEKTWCDHLAASLGAANPRLRYRNLAEARAPAPRVFARQLRAALDQKPDLLSVTCGVNDVLLSREFDADRFEGHMRPAFERIVGELPGVRLLTLEPARFSMFLPVDERRRAAIDAGIDRLNARMRSLSAEFGAIVVDLAADKRSEDRASRHDDGLHPSAKAHSEIAEYVLAVLAGSRPASGDSR